MKEEFIKAAQAAIGKVNMELEIRSSNRKGDQQPEIFMVELEEAKTQIREEMDQHRRPIVEKLLETLEKQALMLMSLRQRQIEAGTKLSEAERMDLMPEVSKIAMAISKLQQELSKMKKLLTSKLDTTTEEDVLITAAASIRTRKGNCDEMSSIAYLHLEMLGIKPIDLISTAENSKNDAHQFVVIGRKNDEPLYDPEGWSEAVVCDPWAGTHVDPKNLTEHLATIGYPDLMLIERLRKQ